MTATNSLRPGGATPAGGARRRGARPETLARGRATNHERAEGRYEDYTWLRTEQRLTVREAADRLGVCQRQAWRYEARMRADGQAVAS